MENQGMSRADTVPVVGVMGSGTRPHTERAEAVGRFLAQEGVHLITGGGGGVMEAVSRAFYTVSPRRGCVLGILPGRVTQEGYASLPGYPNPWVEIPIRTHLPLSGTQGQEPWSRNHINILSACVIIALPGSYGTSSEVALALKYDRPVIAYIDDRNQIPDLPESVHVEGGFEELVDFVRKIIARG